jgi:hypothetical protein
MKGIAMNSNDWLARTGSAYVGLGHAFHRPPHPRVFAAAVAKAAPKRKPRHGPAWRATVLAIAKAKQALLDTPTPRPPTRNVALWKLNRPGIEGQRAYDRQIALLQRWHGPR